MAPPAQRPARRCRRSTSSPAATTTGPDSGSGRIHVDVATTTVTTSPVAPALLVGPGPTRGHRDAGLRPLALEDGGVLERRHRPSADGAAGRATPTRRRRGTAPRARGGRAARRRSATTEARRRRSPTARRWAVRSAATACAGRWRSRPVGRSAAPRSTPARRRRPSGRRPRAATARACTVMRCARAATATALTSSGSTKSRPSMTAWARAVSSSASDPRGEAPTSTWRWRRVVVAARRSSGRPTLDVTASHARCIASSPAASVTGSSTCSSLAPGRSAGAARPTPRSAVG